MPKNLRSRLPKQGLKSGQKSPSSDPVGATQYGKPGKKSAQNVARGEKKIKNKLPAKRDILAAGLPPPNNLTPAEVKALQSKWHDKLEATGFDDIERSQHGDSKGLNQNYLRGSSIRGRTWSPERAQFYRLLQNYITWHQPRQMIDRYILHGLNDGLTYRQILAGCRTKYRYTKSLYSLFYHVKKLVEQMIVWNNTHAEGLLNPANQDQWADDALLSDLRGTAGIIEAPNGLKLDQGWWVENASRWWQENGH